MLTKLKNTALFRAFRKLPLWAQIGLPIVSVVLLLQVVIWLKVFFGIALVLGVVYVIIRASGAGK